VTSKVLIIIITQDIKQLTKNTFLFLSSHSVRFITEEIKCHQHV